MRALALLLSSLLVTTALAAPARRKARVRPAPRKSVAAARKAAAAKAAAAKAAKAKALAAKAAAAKHAAKVAAAKKAAAARAAALIGQVGTPTSTKPATAVPARDPDIDLPGSVVPSVRPPAPRPRTTPLGTPLTSFQTNSDYDPRIDLKTDLVTVHRHGASWDEIDRTIQSWRGAGYPVHRMFFIGSDAGALYTSGKADGTPHPGEVEMDATGKPIALGERPYMVPTAGWLTYLKEHIRRAIDSGAEGIWPEEPLMHAASGYSPAFKTAWEQFYQAPWRDPQESPAAYYRASRLKSDLYLRAVDELLRYTKSYAKEKGRDVKFILPVHSPVSYSAWNLIFPHAAASRLPIDGLVAQVWTGPARTPATYEGKSESQFFESSWLMYSYFANLMDGIGDKPLYLLADPVEDDPKYGWADYEKWYRNVLAASLLFPQARGYEVMPWPDRIYLPGHSTGQGTPGPAAYLTDLSNLISAVRELPGTSGMDWGGGTRGVGVLTLDTMMWQRGGPQGSSMRSFHGLTLPLLKRGVPVEVVPAERVADNGYLNRFKVLLLSYDMQKPLGPEVNQGLAAWVRAGGTLVLVGGADPYTDIGEWWSRNGFAGPTDHLVKESGAGVEALLRTVQVGSNRFREALKAEAPVRSLENRRTYKVSLASYQSEGKPVFVRFNDLVPTDGWGAWVGRVRVLEGSRVRADFRAGTMAERPFLVEDQGSKVDKDHRFADGDASFVYRFNRLGPDATLELELGNQFQVSVASGEDPATTLQPVAEGFAAQRVPSTYPVVSYPLAEAEPLFRSGSMEKAPAWVSPAGAGSVIYCGVPAAYGADSPAGAELVRSLVRFACVRAKLEYREGPIMAKRGPYVIAHALGRTMQLKGQYIDLFKPDLPVVRDPQLPYLEPVFYKEVRMLSRIPTLLHATHRATVLEQNAARLRVKLDGPTGTQGTLRIFPAGMSLAGIDAVDATGARSRVEARIEGRTVRVTYPQQATGVDLTIRWIRPEARLTK